MAGPARIVTAALRARSPRAVRLCVLALVGSLAFLPAASADHDTSAPIVSYTLSGTAGTNGWFRSNVTINWSVIEPEGLTSSTCLIAQLVTAEGTGTYSCTATSHGGTATGQVTLKIDETPPSVPSGTAARSPDANGWYNRPVAVTFTASDATSGIASCGGSTYNGPDSATASAPGSCTDLAGNTSVGSLALQYDAAAPSATAAASRAADANGWYNRELRITFAQAPGDVSGPGTCSPPVDYAGPDAAAVSRSGTCTDRAGNTSSPVSFTFKYDGTPPQAVASASRAPDSNGWYNRPLTISFAQAPGDVSGAGSCTAASTYGGPDTDAVTRSGSCTDAAGNASALASVTFRYDETAPTGVSGAIARPPDANGWFNHAVALAVTGTDGRSGIASCGSPVYTGPDSATASLAGTCTDRAGNTSAPVGATFKYDGTPPTASGAPTRAPDVNGWFNSPLVVAFTGSDALSGIGSCGEQTYSGPDSAAASIAGGCVDKAGNASPAGASTFKYDATPPSVSAAAARPPDGNGWYTRPVGIVAVGSDPVSGVASCTAPAYSGPDTAGVGVGATCTDNAGNTSAPAVATVKYDTVAPSVSAAADRPPDGAGWYRRPLTIGFSASDGLSGVASCTAPVRYDGPDRAGATVAGTCSDAAGNSAGATHAFRYDATAPKPGRLTAEPLKGVVRLGWQRPSDAVAVELVRSPGVNGARSTVVYRGTGRSFADTTVRTGVRYRYLLTLRDEAGNAAGTAVTAMSRLPLHRPALGAVVRAPVVLAWERVAGARFYNVQLLRNGVKVLTAWPGGPRFRLPAAWRFAGERQTLAKGLYRWFVWPARGTHEHPSYGKLLGSSTFRVR
jgi:hypothetical protein